MKYCSKCGKPTADDSQKFCAYCGSAFPTEETNTENTAGASDSELQQNVAGGSTGKKLNNLTDQQKKIAAAVILVVLCALAGTVIRFSKERKPTKNDTTENQTIVVSSQPQIEEEQSPEVIVPQPTESSVEVVEEETVSETAGDSSDLRAEASDTQVVFRNVPEFSVITMDGQPVSYTWINGDAVIPRENLPDVCIIRAIAPYGDNKYQTAAAWYNYRYGNDVTLGDASNYGEYRECDGDGKCEPSYKVVDVLTWAYYTGFLKCINNQTTDYLVYSGENNFEDARDHIFGKQNAKSEYDLTNYQAVCSAPTISYQDGKTCYNASFVCYAKDRETGKVTTISNHRTIELCWQNGMWIVNRIAFLSDDDFNAGRYADLP